jgi:hypothetical protein
MGCLQENEVLISHGNQAICSVRPLLELRPGSVSAILYCLYGPYYFLSHVLRLSKTLCTRFFLQYH